MCISFQFQKDTTHGIVGKLRTIIHSFNVANKENITPNSDLEFVFTYQKRADDPWPFEYSHLAFDNVLQSMLGLSSDTLHLTDGNHEMEVITVISGVISERISVKIHEGLSTGALNYLSCIIHTDITAPTNTEIGFDIPNWKFYVRILLIILFIIHIHITIHLP